LWDSLDFPAQKLTEFPVRGIWGNDPPTRGSVAARKTRAFKAQLTECAGSAGVRTPRDVAFQFPLVSSRPVAPARGRMLSVDTQCGNGIYGIALTPPVKGLRVRGVLAVESRHVYLVQGAPRCLGSAPRSAGGTDRTCRQLARNPSVPSPPAKPSHVCDDAQKACEPLAAPPADRRRRR